MLHSDNGAGQTRAGPWYQHWSVLLGALARDLFVAFMVWGIALYAGWLWLAILAPLALSPSLLRYVRWQLEPCLFLSATDITVKLGVVRQELICFPLHEIEMFQTRKTLLGWLFDYGDITVVSGTTLTFERLHPLSGFLTAYRARSSAMWTVPGRRLLPRPTQSAMVVEGRSRRSGDQMPEAGDGAIDWGVILRPVALCVALNSALILLIGF